MHNNYIINVIKYNSIHKDMIISKSIDQYDNNCIYICDSIKNNIMNEGIFHRIIYSTHNVTLNGVFLFLNFKNIQHEKYYNKIKCEFDVSANISLINKIRHIEFNILNKINLHNKIPQYRISEQLNSGNFKLFTDINLKKNNSFILKISGIWETNNQYGLTYKFLRFDKV